MSPPIVKAVWADVLTHPADLLVLKYAGGFHGVDRLASERFGFTGSVEAGKVATVDGRDPGPRNVAFVGVGRLYEFRYGEIRAFGATALKLTRDSDAVKRLSLTIHGPGYGLDEREAFLALVAGIDDALIRGDFAATLETIEIVEFDKARALRLRQILDKLSSPQISASALSSFGKASETKTRLFVAMPFSKDFDDEWHVAISDASAENQLVCERLDAETFVGDILAEIKTRIEKSNGVVAVVTGANPNVFLEVGYAWGRRKPTMLLSKEGETLPFDIRGQRCLRYSSITDLRNKLRTEFEKLAKAGTFAKAEEI